MNTYIVTEKASGAVVYRYAHDFPISFDDFPFESFDHTVAADEIPAPKKVYGGRRGLTKLEFRRLFSISELNEIDDFAAGYLELGLGVDMEKTIRTNLKSYEEAEDISLDDPDIYSGLQLYAAMGIITPNRIAEVLNG